MTITPYLLYEDVDGAMAFLEEAFGFRPHGPADRGPDGKIRHAEMRLGDAVLMMGRPGDDYRNPKHLGQATQSLYVMVTGVDAHYERARAVGASILEEPCDTPYGHRRYGAADPEGHQWYFAEETGAQGGGSSGRAAPRSMLAPLPEDANGEERVYRFDRGACLRFALFLGFWAVAAVVVAVVGARDRFVYGLVPGWLFGSVAAVVLSTFSASWGWRLTHRGPALILSETGISADRRLGGLLGVRIEGEIGWDEILGARVDRHRTVVVELADPDAFWARQTLRARAFAWSPSGGLAHVPLAGNALDASPVDVATSIGRRARGRLGDPPSRRGLPGGANE